MKKDKFLKDTTIIEHNGRTYRWESNEYLNTNGLATRSILYINNVEKARCAGRYFEAKVFDTSRRGCLNKLIEAATVDAKQYFLESQGLTQLRGDRSKTEFRLFCQYDFEPLVELNTIKNILGSGKRETVNDCKHNKTITTII